MRLRTAIAVGSLLLVAGCSAAQINKQQPVKPVDAPGLVEPLAQPPKDNITLTQKPAEKKDGPAQEIGPDPKKIKFPEKDAYLNIERECNPEYKEKAIRYRKTIRASAEENIGPLMELPDISGVRKTEIGTNSLDVTTTLKIPLSEIGIPENETILDMHCRRGDILLVLTNDKYYVVKVNENQDGTYNLERIIPGMPHTDVGEYDNPQTKVLRGTIERNDYKSWENLTTITITNDGVLQTTTISFDTWNMGQYDRSFCNLGIYLRNDMEAKWPKAKDVVDVKLAMVSADEYIVVPIGKSGAEVTTTYFIRKKGSDFGVFPLNWKEIGVVNILESSDPQYWPPEGGWMISARCLMDDGEIKNMPLACVPRNVKLKGEP